MAYAADIRTGVNDVIAAFGESVTILDKTDATRTVTMAPIAVPGDNEQLVNAIGIGGKVFYMRGTDTPPDKFDILTLTSVPGMKYTVIEKPEPFIVAGSIVGYEILGKQ